MKEAMADSKSLPPKDVPWDLPWGLGQYLAPDLCSPGARLPRRQGPARLRTPLQRLLVTHCSSWLPQQPLLRQ
jgi:hypothetical protein